MELNSGGKLATIDVLGERSRPRGGEAHRVCLRRRLPHDRRARTGLERQRQADRSRPQARPGGLQREPRAHRAWSGRAWALRPHRHGGLELHGRHVALYRELREDGLDNVGIVLQCYLRRTLDDIASLVDLTPNVRLCKGIYVEPLKIAYHDFDQVRSNFVRALEALLAGGSYVGIATHDEWLLTEERGSFASTPGREAVRVPDVAGRPRGPGRSARRRRPPAADLRPLRGAVVRLFASAATGEPEDRGYIASDTLGRLLPGRNGRR